MVSPKHRPTITPTFGQLRLDGNEATGACGGKETAVHVFLTQPKRQVRGHEVINTNRQMGITVRTDRQMK